MEPRHFPHRHAAVVLVMNRSRTRKRAPCGIGARPQGIGKTVGIQLEESGRFVDGARWGLGEAIANFLRVIGPSAAG